MADFYLVRLSNELDADEGGLVMFAVRASSVEKAEQKALDSIKLQSPGYDWKVERVSSVNWIANNDIVFVGFM